MLTHPNLRIPEETAEFAINASNSRYWEPAIKRYVNECLAGQSGPRARDFNMRWIASLVAETHRILMRGGVFMYPRDRKDLTRPGRLRLLYEANPIGFPGRAGGRACQHRASPNPGYRAGEPRAPADQLRIRRTDGGRAYRAVSPRSQRFRVRCAPVRDPRSLFQD